MHHSPPTVFLSYAAADTSIAREIAHDLRVAGVPVRSDEIDLRTGQPVASLRASDVLLLLLSPSAVRSPWVKQELTSALISELSDRAVTVIPALIADCELPLALRDRHAFDLRSDRRASLRRLVDQLSVLPEIDFGRLGYAEFESLVAQLLAELGFVVSGRHSTRDGGFDLDAYFSYDGPLGTERDRWLVEVKLYQHTRFSVASVRQLFGALHAQGVTKGLIVTSGQPTSAAREFVQEVVARSGIAIKIIDGVTLTALLLERPYLVRRFFGGGAT